MAPTTSNLRLFLSMGALLALLAPGCASEGVLEASEPECSSGDCLTSTTPDGEDPHAFCDDQDPCTTDANCTPCSTLPAADQDAYHCTADQDLPDFCAGHLGCIHVLLTTPPGVTNSCFPVAGDADLHAGVCWFGTCVDNKE
jgi:hypothetical protein